MKIKTETEYGEQTFILTSFPQDFPGTTLLKLDGYAGVLIGEKRYKNFPSRLNTMDQYDLNLAFAREIGPNNYNLK